MHTFRVYLLGKPFIIQTDHRALKWLDQFRETNTRLTRWSLALQPYSYTVEYRTGASNGNADGLSRAFPDTTSSQEKGRETEHSQTSLLRTVKTLTQKTQSMIPLRTPNLSHLKETIRLLQSLISRNPSSVRERGFAAKRDGLE